MKITFRRVIVSLALLFGSCDSPKVASPREQVVINVQSIALDRLIPACRELVASGVTPGDIAISDKSGVRVAYSSCFSAGDESSLATLYSGMEYKGQIIILTEDGERVVYSGSQLDCMWVIVDNVSFRRMAEYLNKNQNTKYIIDDFKHFRESAGDFNEKEKEKGARHAVT